MGLKARRFSKIACEKVVEGGLEMVLKVDGLMHGESSFGCSSGSSQ
jgi:hypothetical protein